MNFSSIQPLLHRRRTWLLLALCLGVIGGLSWWWQTNRDSNTIAAMAHRGQPDSAWASLKASQGRLSDCQRQGLSALIAEFDERTDTLLLKLADSLKTCYPPPESLLTLVSEANLRIAKHSPNLDSSQLWTLQATAFQTANQCIKLDSNHRKCYQLAFDALTEMGDSYSQLAWLKMTQTRWPNDTTLGNQMQRTIAHKPTPTPTPK